ncbi:MAG: exo-beta-N-acetylmuramidase NamZ family protein [Candidatus Nanopelagicales bacterium]
MSFLVGFAMLGLVAAPTGAQGTPAASAAIVVNTQIATASATANRAAMKVKIVPDCPKKVAFTVQKLTSKTVQVGSDEWNTVQTWTNKGKYHTAKATQSKTVKLAPGVYRARVSAACGNPAVLTNSVTLEKFQLGADRTDVYGKLLAGKRVGLMVNQSSIDSKGRHTIEQMIATGKKYGFTVTTLYSVEHGLRGNEEAGFGDPDYIDPTTGLQVYSLYGRDENGNPRNQPSAERLANIDVMVYDLQDVGVRFFTYTVSLQLVMESLQANDKEVMVLDRPNPNGDSIYGPLLEAENVSGIGTMPIPMAHGLTSGEVAEMIVGQGWLNGLDHATNQWEYFGQPQYQMAPEKVHVVAMTGYLHGDRYELPVRPSPNLATFNSVRLYPSLGLFEATSVNMGRGSAYPHEQLGFPDPRMYVNTTYTLADDLTTVGGWPHGGKQVWGESLRQEVTGIDPMDVKASVRPFVEWWFRMTANGYKARVPEAEESIYLKNAMSAYVIRPLWLAKVVGTRSFLANMESASAQGMNVDQTVAYVEAAWQAELNQYRVMRTHYVLYPDVA